MLTPYAIPKCPACFSESPNSLRKSRSYRDALKPSMMSVKPWKGWHSSWDRDAVTRLPAPQEASWSFAHQKPTLVIADLTLEHAQVIEQALHVAVHLVGILFIVTGFVAVVSLALVVPECLVLLVLPGVPLFFADILGVFVIGSADGDGRNRIL